ncbi:HDIG domain-containing metalloprotein [uncultured Sunxiuqinia sp.]|uniref:HD family phosphohydrolase n=1 Tax=uncultured Sunxiuqinia sp. TaxID=1573825 RepID=UPI0030DA6129|tara:strand:- start:290 stop:2356 length:2067 start_codon:yes stop_codon:yes gene_type:complete
MKKLLTRLARYYHFFYIAFAFLATVFLLYLIIPGESRFKYEFQKNSPWRHETLVAPFNFAILKADEDVKLDQDSVRSKYIPYLKIDTLQRMVQTNNLAKSLEQFDLDTATVRNLSHFLAELYETGLIEQAPENHPGLQNKNEVILIKDKLAKHVPTDELLTLKTAYQKLSDTIRSSLGNDFGTFYETVNLSDFIVANISYDEEFNMGELQKRLDEVSITQGMVQAGERIIFKGDIITPDKYVILDSLKRSYETKRGQDIERYLLILGKLILIISCLLILIFYLYYFRPEIFNQKRRLSFILIMIVLMVFTSRFVNDRDFMNLYLVPVAILPILLRIFFDSRTAIFTLLVTTLLIGYFAPNNFEYIFLNQVAGIIAVFSLDKLHRRSHLILTAFWVFLAYSVVFLALSMIQEGNIESIPWRELEWFGGNALLILLAYPLIYIFEKLFGFVSDVTLIELSDTNQPLLRKLAQEAPGTFQHSMQIANLAEEVILRIGGNPFLVRAGALYHDIGKTNQPAYFIENQAAGMSPHSKLDNKESAKIIIDHVTRGVKIARRHKLPEVLIEFISSHHGTSQAKYFYTTYKNEHPNEEVDPKEFTYPGPPPKNKETSVVMLTDGIEAAARAMKEKSLENLRVLIEKIVQDKIDTRQLDNADLTLREIRIFKETILEKLMNIYHIRIEYPEDRSQNKK